MLIRALALCALPVVAQAQGVAYLIDRNLNQLFTVDLLTGGVTWVASTANNNLVAPIDLTWKHDTQD